MTEPVAGKTTRVRRPNLMRAACIGFAVWTGAAILSSRCLYADGAHEFVKVLQARDFVTLMWSRHFAFYIYEFPLVLAIKLGVTNLAWLRLAFGLGCLLPWPMVMICCHWISPKHFWLVVVGCAAGYLNAAFMAVGEHILADAFFWPALFSILFARPLKPLAAVILLASAAGLLFSYESQLILCVPLALLALWRSWREKKEGNRWTWVIFLVAAALFLAGITIGLCAVLMPEIRSNFIGFRAGTLGLLGHLGWTLTWTMIWAGLVLTGLFSENFWRIMSHQVGIYLLFAVFMVWGTWPLLVPSRLDNGIQYDNRVLDLLVPLALLPAALILRFRPEWIELKEGRIAQLAAALLIAQSLWQLSATLQWYRDVIWMQDILVSRHGIIPLRSTVLAADGMEGRELYKDAIGGRFDWVWPCLSVALSPSPKINSLICSEVFMDPTIRLHYWQPFDPFKPETLPQLEHYGIDFTGYTAALRKERSSPP
jgi:hypothetical protein